jgi:hypothetical protein
MSFAARRGLSWYEYRASAPSRAQPLIPALTPPAQAGAKGARALGTPVSDCPFPAGRRERELRGRAFREEH